MGRRGFLRPLVRRLDPWAPGPSACFVWGRAPWAMVAASEPASSAQVAPPVRFPRRALQLLRYHHRYRLRPACEPWRATRLSEAFLWAFETAEGSKPTAVSSAVANVASYIVAPASLEDDAGLRAEIDILSGEAYSVRVVFGFRRRGRPGRRACLGRAQISGGRGRLTGRSPRRYSVVTSGLVGTTGYGR